MVLTKDVEVGVGELIAVSVADVALDHLRICLRQVPVGQSLRVVASSWISRSIWSDEK